MSPFVSALVQICQEENSTVTVESIRNSALEKIMSGGGKELQNSSINGRSFSFQINMAATQLFAEASEAIRTYAGDNITSVRMDFSSL